MYVWISLVALLVSGLPVYRNTTCGDPAIGVFNLDSSAATCPVVAQCRRDFCECLDAPDGNSCWLRSVTECDTMSACVSAMTHCVMLAGANSTSGACAHLRSEYNSSTTNDFSTSPLAAGCAAVACNIFRQRSTSAVCSLDTDIVCAPVSHFHGTLQLGGSPSVFQSMLSTSNYAAARDALQSDLRSLTNLPVVVRGIFGHLTAIFYVANSTVPPAALSVGASSSNWLLRFSAEYVALGGPSDLSVISLRETTTVSTKAELAAACDGPCVGGIATAVVVLVLCIICIGSVVRYRVRQREKMNQVEDGAGPDEHGEDDGRLVQSSPELRQAIKQANRHVREVGLVLDREVQVDRIRTVVEDAEERNEPVE